MLTVTILGNNSALPTSDRHPTAQLVTCDGQHILVDCGEGTQMQMFKYQVRRSKITHIFISHLHGDHYFGLIGLLTSFSLLDRKQPLYLYGPEKLKQIIDLQLSCASTSLGYELIFTPISRERSTILLELGNLTVSCFPTHHRIPCYGFLFREIFKKRKILIEQAEKWKIPHTYYSKLQEGKDYVTPDGSTVKNEEVTQEPSSPLCYAFCADTLYDEGLIPHIQDCNLIYHETTYLDDQRERAVSRFHSTSIQAATLAKKAGVKKLLIGHFSSKYEHITPFLEECRTVFPQTELAKEGQVFTVE